MEQGVTRRADHRKGFARVEKDLPVGADQTGAKTDARTMSLADAPKTHHESHGAFRYVRLIGVEDDARIADRGRLERVLVSERGAQQEPALLTQVFFRV